MHLGVVCSHSNQSLIRINGIHMSKSSLLTAFLGASRCPEVYENLYPRSVFLIHTLWPSLPFSCQLPVYDALRKRGRELRLRLNTLRQEETELDEKYYLRALKLPNKTHPDVVKSVTRGKDREGSSHLDLR